MHVQISLCTKFRLKLTRLNFCNKLIQKGYFQYKKKKKITIKFDIFNLIYVINFSLRKQFEVLEKSSKNRILPVENRKNQHHHLHIRISLGIDFQLKVTILIFFSRNLPKKRCFQSKTGKMDITIFKLVFESNFILNKQLWIFDPNLPKKVFFGLKKEKWTPSLNSAYWN